MSGTTFLSFSLNNKLANQRHLSRDSSGTAYVFLVMLPVKMATGDSNLAWQAGLLACLGSGIIELCGSPFAGWLRKNVPRAALLSALAGIAMTLISMEFLFRQRG